MHHWFFSRILFSKTCSWFLIAHNFIISFQFCKQEPRGPRHKKWCFRFLKGRLTYFPRSGVVDSYISIFAICLQFDQTGKHEWKNSTSYKNFQTKLLCHRFIATLLCSNLQKVNFGCVFVKIHLGFSVCGLFICW